MAKEKNENNEVLDEMKTLKDRIEKDIDKEVRNSYERDERIAIKRFTYLIKEGKKEHINLKYNEKNKRFSYVIYSCIRGVGCSVGNHKNTVDSRLILSSSRFDYFDFAFCKKCLNDLVNIIFDFYFIEGTTLSREGNIQITSEDVKGSCFSCGSAQIKYQITIGNKSFVMCKNCFKKFCETIMYSEAVRELFQSQFKEFRKLQQDEIAQEEKNRMVRKVYQPKNKSQCRSFVLNSFGAENINKFSYITVQNIKCNFCEDESNLNAKVVLGTNRQHNVLSLAYCQECAKQIYEVIHDSIVNSKTVYNKELKIRCKPKSEFPKNNCCYVCGLNEGSAFQITHGHCSFTLCAKCAEKYANQLSVISEI